MNTLHGFVRKVVVQIFKNIFRHLNVDLYYMNVYSLWSEQNETLKHHILKWIIHFKISRSYIQESEVKSNNLVSVSF